MLSTALIWAKIEEKREVSGMGNTANDQALAIRLCDVFISWTGRDAEIKKAIAESLRAYGLEPLLSDEQCQGNFVIWSRNAATSAHIFMTVITEHALISEGMAWEREAIDEKLCSEEGEFWQNAIIPICTDLNTFEAYKARFSPQAQAMLRELSAIILELDGDGKPTQRCLTEICAKTSQRILSHMHTRYTRMTGSGFMKLISLYANVPDRAHPFEDLYINRKITETDQSHQTQTFSTPEALLDAESIAFLQGPAGSGKSQYIHEIRASAGNRDLVLTLSCPDVVGNDQSLFELMYDQYCRVCGIGGYFTQNHFRRFLQVKRLVLVLDGMDEIATQTATRDLVNKTATYFHANASMTKLIFTSRNEKDANLLAFGGRTVRRFRLDKLTDAETRQLAENLFRLFDEEEKAGEFYARVQTLSDDIRTNPLLLTQLAIVYHDSGDIPKTVAGILEAVSQITLRSDKAMHGNLQAIPEPYRPMVESHIAEILKRFCREKYEKASQGKFPGPERILNHILKAKYGESKDACRQRTEFLLDYLRNRAIFADGKFHHKLFLEYFAASSFIDDSIDEDYGEIEDYSVIDSLFTHYSDPYWSDLIRLYLAKADSALDCDATETLYKHILAATGLTEYTLLFDTCRELTECREAAQLVLVADILEKSARGIYPPYGPLFWYVPEYGLYETAVLAAGRLSGDPRALALVRDVCVIFSGKHTLDEITSRVSGSDLFAAAQPGLSGVREGLCELFCTGTTGCQSGRDIYPRCFNLREAEHQAAFGYGVTGRFEVPFADELGLWSPEGYHTLGGEYIGFLSCPYDKTQMEQALRLLPTVKVRGMALINTGDTKLDYVEFVRTSVRVLYVPENIIKFGLDYALFMPIEVQVRIYDGDLCYLPVGLRRFVVPEGTQTLPNRMFSGDRFLEQVVLPPGLRCIERGAFENCPSLHSIHFPDSLTQIGHEAFKNCTALRHIALPPSLTRIGMNAFDGCRNLESITIPPSVTDIGIEAFHECSLLSSVELPPFLTRIDYSAFFGCSSLRHIRIPDSVARIENAAFAYCTALESITLPDSVTRLGVRAFAYCASLESVTLSASLTALPMSLFKDCTGLRHITLPDSVTDIGMSAFQGCTGLERITLPDSVTSIQWGAFAGCTGLRHVTLPKDLAVLPFQLFDNCIALESVTIPESVTEIGAGAFAGCTSLASITIPPSVTAILQSAFEDCACLESITIPPSVTELGTDVFRGCDNLRTVRLPALLRNARHKIPPGVLILCTETGLPFEEEGLNRVLVIPEGQTEILSREFADSDIESILLPDSLTKIGSDAFWGCKKLEQLRIPPAVTQIGSYAFSKCSALQCVQFPHGLTKIGSFAFNGCTGLTHLELPDSVAELDIGAFSDCHRLASIRLPDLLTVLPDSIFANCSELRSITLPSSLTDIKSGAFSGCTFLAGVTIPASLKRIHGTAFKNCVCLESITLPDSMGMIGSLAFQGCVSLRAIRIPAGITTVNQYTFKGCRSLSRVQFPSTLTRIAQGAFADCTALTVLNIPDSVTQIDRDAFEGCKNLMALELSSSLTEIGKGAFFRCSSLSTLTIPKSVRRIGDGAFLECPTLESVVLSANFKNDILRIFGPVNPDIFHFI